MSAQALGYYSIKVFWTVFPQLFRKKHIWAVFINCLFLHNILQILTRVWLIVLKIKIKLVLHSLMLMLITTTTTLLKSHLDSTLRKKTESFFSVFVFFKTTTKINPDSFARSYAQVWAFDLLRKLEDWKIKVKLVNTSYTQQL